MATARMKAGKNGMAAVMPLRCVLTVRSGLESVECYLYKESNAVLE